MRIKEFLSGGGGGVSRPDGKKTTLTAFFFCLCVFFVVLNLLTEGFQWFHFREGLSYEEFSDIPMFQDWGQSILKLHV